jgi:predicted PurR-regulated permease PerM
VALAVIAFPVHAWIARRVPSANGAAGITTAVVVTLILVPLVLVVLQVVEEASALSGEVGEFARNGQIDDVIGRAPGGAALVEWVRTNVDVGAEAQRLVSWFAGDAIAFAQGSVWVAVQLLVCVFVLFFAFRDWQYLLAAVRGVLPLTREEADYLFTRVSGSIHATVYATIMTSLLQGVAGGLLFWALGLPAPVLWGVVMTILGILPVLGAFFVWVPAAIYLASVDRWGAAIGLVAWGILMAGPVCNYVYAYLAGGRMRMHPVPVLIAFVGGLVVFGISGMVLGPVILAVTSGLIDVWRRKVSPEGFRAKPGDRTGSVPESDGDLFVPSGARDRA